jgi:biotin transport system substrate-specific component
MSLHKYFTGTNVALVAVFAGLIAASTAVPEVTLISGVPLSLQTFATVLAALVLGPWRGFAAVGLYVIIGLAGAPIFANGFGGLTILAGPTWGYMLGMLIATIPVGLIVVGLRRRGALTFVSLLGAGLVSIPVIYAFGVPVLAYKLGLPIFAVPGECEGIGDFSSGCVTGVSVGVIPFVAGDLVKVFAAAAVASAIHRAYPWILGTTSAVRSSGADAPVASAGTAAAEHKASLTEAPVADDGSTTDAATEQRGEQQHGLEDRNPAATV